ncbi:MAG: Maf family protein [Caulobacteraceae bacterium]
MSPTVILASKSASRQALLRGAGVAFEPRGSGVDEDITKARITGSGGGPKEVAEALAAEKALAVSRTTPGLVIGADQTLDFQGALVDKAESMAEARSRLRALRGQTHYLHAALAIAQDGVVIWTLNETASLTMRGFSDDWLDGYLERAGEQLLGSVGCYQLEGEGVQLFSAIEGDYFAILGLPLVPLLSFLRDKGALAE